MAKAWGSQIWQFACEKTEQIGVQKMLEGHQEMEHKKCIYKQVILGQI